MDQKQYPTLTGLGLLHMLDGLSCFSSSSSKICSQWWVDQFCFKTSGLTKLEGSRQDVGWPHQVCIHDLFWPLFWTEASCPSKVMVGIVKSGETSSHLTAEDVVTLLSSMIDTWFCLWILTGPFWRLFLQMLPSYLSGYIESVAYATPSKETKYAPWVGP